MYTPWTFLRTALNSVHLSLARRWQKRQCRRSGSGASLRRRPLHTHSSRLRSTPYRCQQCSNNFFYKPVSLQLLLHSRAHMLVRFVAIEGVLLVWCGRRGYDWACQPARSKLCFFCSRAVNWSWHLFWANPSLTLVTISWNLNIIMFGASGS
jgi:hypothetical protein